MRYLLPLVLGLAIGAGVFWYLEEPAGLESLSLAAFKEVADKRAEAAQAEYEQRQAELTERVEEAKQRGDIAEAALAKARAEHSLTVDLELSIKKAEATVEALEQERAGLKVALKDAEVALESALATGDISASLTAEKILEGAIDERVNNLESQVEHLQISATKYRQEIVLKDKLIEAMDIDVAVREAQWRAEKDLRVNAEKRVEELTGGGLKFGLGVQAGAVKPFQGSWAPGYGVGLNVTYTW